MAQTTPRSKTLTSANIKTESAKGNGLFQTVVFSRKTTTHGPDEVNSPSGKSSISKKQQQQQLANLNPNPLASLIHQTDASGKQQAIVQSTGAPGGAGRAATASPRRLQRAESDNAGGQQQQGSFRNLLTNIWSALGISDQQQTAANIAAQRPTTESSPTKAAFKAGTKSAAPSRVVELRKSVIPPAAPHDAAKKCLVLDLDETLVHSSFKPTQNPDYIIPVEIDGTVHQVYVCKRPGAEAFLVEMAKHYEIVVYTASLSKYADPLLDRLDPENTIRFRLFREHCVQYEGNYVKDLSLLDRDISQTIIIDNSPMSYLFHPRNALGCSSFIDDMDDRELDSMARFLINIRDADDVRAHLHSWDANY